MQPLNIANSQLVARGTTIVAEFFMGRKRIAHMSKTLSALVWDGMDSSLVREQSFASLGSVATCLAGAQGVVRAPVDNLFVEPFDGKKRRSDVVEIHLAVSRRLSFIRLRKTLLFSLSRLEKGTTDSWKVFYRSKLTTGSQQPKCFSRDFLFEGGDVRPPLRFSLLEMKDAFTSRILGHADLSFEDLALYRGDFPCSVSVTKENRLSSVALHLNSFLQREDGMLQLSILWTTSTIRNA